MFKNYFKTAWRNLMKNKMFSFINVFGLSAGLACCMLISLYILNEFSYDKYQKNADDIYQLGTTFIQHGEEHSNTHTPAHMAQAIHADIVLFHVYAIPIIYSEVPTGVNVEEVRLAAELNIAQLKAHLKHK